jgi:hypothetical protein
MKINFTCALLIVLVFNLPAQAYYHEYHKDVEFIDLIHGEGEGPELIVYDTKGLGSGHYIETVRIYVNEYPDLRLIFQLVTLQRHMNTAWYPGQNIAFAQEFQIETREDGVSDILVDISKRIYEGEYGDELTKVEHWGQMRFVWDDEHYVMADDFPEQLKERHRYEEDRMNKLRNSGEVIGNHIYFKRNIW